MFTQRNIIFNIILKIIPENILRGLVKKYNTDRYKKCFSLKALLVILLFSQITQQKSLKDLELALWVKRKHLYHWGIQSICPSTIAYNNQFCDYHLFKELFYKILGPLTAFYAELSETLYSLDSSTITLPKEKCSWAPYRKHKGGIKVHVVLKNGFIPIYVKITTGNTADINACNQIGLGSILKKGDIIAMDRGYVDYGLYKELTNSGITFVTRIKKNMEFIVKKTKYINKGGIKKDQIIELFRPGKPHDYCKYRIVYSINRMTGSFINL